MIYEVRFCSKEKNEFTCFHSELISANGVTECRKIANEIVQDFKKDTKVFIEEFIA